MLSRFVGIIVAALDPFSVRGGRSLRRILLLAASCFYEGADGEVDEDEGEAGVDEDVRVVGPGRAVARVRQAF